MGLLLIVDGFEVLLETVEIVANNKSCGEQRQTSNPTITQQFDGDRALPTCLRPQSPISVVPAFVFQLPNLSLIIPTLLTDVTPFIADHI